MLCGMYDLCDIVEFQCSAWSIMEWTQNYRGFFSHAVVWWSGHKIIVDFGNRAVDGSIENKNFSKNSCYSR